MPPPSPTVANWELVLRLRQRREQLDFKGVALPATLGSPGYWSAVENERRIPSADKLARILADLEFDEDEQRELLELSKIAKTRGWWSHYSALFGKELLRLYGMEYGSQSIRTYDNLLIPGLLQTDDYARALMSADLSVRQTEIDQRVEVRLRRQQRLLDDDPLHLTAIISQAALLQQIGGPDVLRRQLAHLTTMIDQHPDTIEIRVIPFTVTSGIFGASTFYLIDFASPRLPTLAWQETVTASGIIHDDTAVRDLHLTYAQALNHSLSAQDSRNLIHHHSQEQQ
jgi:transcriptional regulator with XRE-family HTH domain